MKIRYRQCSLCVKKTPLPSIKVETKLGISEMIICAKCQDKMMFFNIGNFSDTPRY